MIKENELRIGNYILFNGKVISISAKGLYDFAYTHDYTGKHEPIPLTPEILEKAGFDRLPLSSVKRYGIKTKLFYLQIEKGKWYLYGYRFYPYGLTTLHQLQNLYYALTGEELEINL